MKCTCYLRSFRVTKVTFVLGMTSSTSTTPQEDLESTSVEPSQQSKPETSTSTDGHNENNASVSAEEQEQSAILETMDADSCVLRQRRIAFYDNRRDTLISK